jgi:Undecaprenyl-phosphate galactose phosphotransferase WbaP
LTIQHANEATPSRISHRQARLPFAKPHVVPDHERGAHADYGSPLVVVSSIDGCGLTALSSARDAQREWTIYGCVKRVLDVIGAVVLGVVFSPLIFVIVLMMRRDGGPIIYKHQRVGRAGQLFECLKFRTMVPYADRALHELLEQRPELKAEWIKDHKLRNDPRVTTIGRFLRRTSLDELPQIWNVIRGEMSLVGPRPVVREELFRYGRSTLIYTSTKPGITGLWQVNGRNNTDYRRRVAMDVYYVRRRSLVLDVYILLRTTSVVLAGNGAF